LKLLSLLIVIGIVFLYRFIKPDLDEPKYKRSEYIDYYIDTNGDIVYHKSIDSFV